MLATKYLVYAILLMSLVTFSVRALPFYCIEFFKDHPIVRYLSIILPATIMPILVFYSFMIDKSGAAVHYIPEIAASLLIVFIHIWRRNLMISMIVGITAYVIFYELALSLMA